MELLKGNRAVYGPEQVNLVEICIETVSTWRQQKKRIFLLEHDKTLPNFFGRQILLSVPLLPTAHFLKYCIAPPWRTEQRASLQAAFSLLTVMLIIPNDYNYAEVH